MAEIYYDPLSDMSRMKESLMSLFCDTQDITRLIMPESDHTDFTFEQNWYGGTFEETVNGEIKKTTLTGHCFDTPYIEGTVMDNGCAIFVETYLEKLGSRHIKEVGVDIYVVCHRDCVRLSEDDTEYYNAIGIYGNRVDSAVQAIHAAILSSDMMRAIKKNYSIGDMALIEEKPIKQYTPGTAFYGKCLSYTYQSFYQRKNNTR